MSGKTRRLLAGRTHLIAYFVPLDQFISQQAKAISFYIEQSSRTVITVIRDNTTFTTNVGVEHVTKHVQTTSHTV
jgi:hypothetical protein